MDSIGRPINLIQNAGVAAPQKIESLTEYNLKRHFDVNITAPSLILSKSIKHLQGGGRVMHISSGMAHNPMKGMMPYCVTKSSLFMLYNCANKELNDLGIYVGTVSPGVVDSNMQDKLRQAKVAEFPMVEEFVGFKERCELQSPDLVAKFMYWLLFSTSNEEYVKSEWRLYDKSHHKFWTEGESVKQRKMI